MIDLPWVTAQQFEDRMIDSPYIDLWRGEVKRRTPFGPECGDIVYALSKALGRYFLETRQGYACHGLGLWLTEQPDTVIRPVISCFLGGIPFAECDRIVTRTVPELVVDLLTAEDHHHQRAERRELLFAHGCQTVWEIDFLKQSADYTSAGGPTETVSRGSLLTTERTLPGFQISVDRLFAETE